MREAIEKTTDAVKVDVVQAVRPADDQATLANTGLQHMIDILNVVSKKCELENQFETDESWEKK